MVEHAPLARAAAAVGRHGFDVSHERPLGLLKVQLRGLDAEARLRDRLGLDLPPPGRWSAGGIGQCAWLAPGEWLLAAEEKQATELARDLRDLLAGDLALVTDLTHGRSSFLISGVLAPERIAAACPLDLRDQSFPPGACAGSILGEARVFLARLLDRDLAPAYRLVVDQTLAAYALRLLGQPSRR
jgi:sarcosine oxidase subunit gamma